MGRAASCVCDAAEVLVVEVHFQDLGMLGEPVEQSASETFGTEHGERKPQANLRHLSPPYHPATRPEHRRAISRQTRQPNEATVL